MQKIDLLQNRLFADGYGSTEERLTDVDAVSKIIERVNQAMFRGAGIVRVVPVVDEENPRDDGVSGMVVGPGGHATLHTFSKRRVYFVDSYLNQPYDKGMMSQLADEVFKPTRLDASIDNQGTGFGRHVIIQLPLVQANRHAQLANRIMAAIQMKSLCEPMVYAQSSGDYLQPITTSHIGLHNLAMCDRAGNVSHTTVLDVFSCRRFSIPQLTDALDDFGVLGLTMNLIGITRGIHMAVKQP